MSTTHGMAGWLGLGAGVFLGLASPAMGQARALVVSTSGDAATIDLPDIDDEEMLTLTPGSGRPIASFLGDLSWRAVLGDANANGRYDDEPAEIDAIAFPPGFRGRPTIYDAFFSFGSTQHFTSGQDALDGDVVRLRPDGSIDVIVPESTFAGATGTSSVDLDAFAMDAAGNVYFSFADNETTTSEPLIAQNGGATLEDGCIFRIGAGASTATLVQREADVAVLVSNALGRTVTSVVDVTEVELDPDHEGQLLFVVGSTASGLEGTVFTTANGGGIATVNGVPLAGSSMGFATEEGLDGLALVDDFGSPLALETESSQISLSATSVVNVRVLNGTPGGRVRILASPVRSPHLPPAPATGPGVGWLYVDATSPLYQRSATRPRYAVAIDSTGAGTFVYATAQTMAGITRVLQPIDETTGQIGEAIVLETIP